MNPFALHGFDFLFFYLVVGIAMLWGLRAWLRRMEGDDRRGRPNMTDPYLIAHLRAGGNESLRVATVALIDRGLLVAKDDILSTRNDGVVDLALRPVEKAILKRYLNEGKAHEIFKDAGAMVACNSYEKTLVDTGLIADGRTYARRFLPVLAAICLLGAIAVIKVNMALSDGRHNIGFTILLAIVFGFIALSIGRQRQTGRGVALLADLRSLFARLKGRAGSLRNGGQTNEAALLAAVFGLSALPAIAFPFAKKLYPQRASDGSGCGSSCSSSCGATPTSSWPSTDGPTVCSPRGCRRSRRRKPPDS